MKRGGENSISRIKEWFGVGILSVLCWYCLIWKSHSSHFPRLERWIDGLMDSQSCSFNKRCPAKKVKTEDSGIFQPWHVGISMDFRHFLVMSELHQKYHIDCWHESSVIQWSCQHTCKNTLDFPTSPDVKKEIKNFFNRRLGEEFGLTSRGMWVPSDPEQVHESLHDMWWKSWCSTKQQRINRGIRETWIFSKIFDSSIGKQPWLRLLYRCCFLVYHWVPAISGPQMTSKIFPFAAMSRPSSGNKHPDNPRDRNNGREEVADQRSQRDFGFHVFGDVWQGMKSMNHPKYIDYII